MHLSPPRVRAAREAAALSQREVAEAAQVSIDTVRRAENGLNEPGANALARIALALGVTIDSLFVHGENATAPANGRVHEQDKTPAPAAALARESAAGAR